MKYEIHEFSTGIQAERTEDGGWISRGFTGEYLNKTINPIPRAVQEAISNRNFSVAEGASRDEPAFVGREVAGYGEQWSVVAVVTRGRDDRGRSASMYRYFLCEGLGNLGKILSWINTQKQAGQNIIFDPFDTQILDRPHEYTESELDLPPLRPELQSFLKNQPPIIIPSDSPCTALLVNQMAIQARLQSNKVSADEETEREKENRDPDSPQVLIAWAYKVEALEEPRGFQVIQPASTRAEELLRKAIASKPNAPAPVSGERNIIAAINGLVKRDRVKPEQIEVIENALANPQIDSSYWESLFKGRGTDKALKQGIYTPEMVRLLTLRSMLIPETLPEFLIWIDKGEKQEECQTVSDTFQAEIKKSLNKLSGQATNLIERVYLGTKLIIPQLVKQPQLLNCVVWLLGSTQGIWGYFYSHQLKQDIENDLTLMPRYVRRKEQDLSFKLIGDREWQKLFNELQKAWRYPAYTESKYQPLAELFSQLKNYQLSAFFYHVCSGVVPKEVFYKLSRRGFRTQVYGVSVKRHIDFYEYLWITTITIGGVELKAIVVFFILLSGFLMGGVSSKLLSASEKSINQIAKDFTNSYNNSEFNTDIKVKKVKNQIILLFQNNDQQSKTLKELKCKVAENLSLIEESCPISESIINNAKKNFEQSQNNLIEIKRQVEIEIQGYYETKINELVSSNKQEQGKLEEHKNSVIMNFNSTLKQILDPEESLNLQNCIFSDSCKPNQKEIFQKNWIQGIYSYQKNKNKQIKPDGILNDELAKQLKNDVIQKLNISIN